jgi:hypothetical protein
MIFRPSFVIFMELIDLISVRMTIGQNYVILKFILGFGID